MTEVSDDGPTGPLPVIPPRNVPANVEVDPLDPLGLGLPQRSWITSVNEHDPVSHDAPVASEVHDSGDVVPLDEFWDQAVALATEDHDEPQFVEDDPEPSLPGAAAEAGSEAGSESAPESASGASAEASAGPKRAPMAGPAPLSGRWRAGLTAGVAVAAVVVGIVVFRVASPQRSQPASGGPAFTLPTGSLATAAGTNSANDALGPPPGLAALPTAAATPSVAPTPPLNAPNVTVLNETTTHGLGAKEADLIRAAGWTVRRVTNVHALQSETTVYYDPTQEAAAKALIAAVPSVKVALPRPSYLLRTGGLIVVVAADAA